MPDIGPSGALERPNGAVVFRTPEPVHHAQEGLVAATARILGARWTIQILFHLARPMRFCELQQAVGGVNPRTLSQRLQFLRAEGLVELLSTGGAARYNLTQAGSDLVPLLDGLRYWQSQWLTASDIQNSPAARVRPIENEVAIG